MILPFCANVGSLATMKAVLFLLRLKPLSQSAVSKGEIDRGLITSLLGL